MHPHYGDSVAQLVEHIPFKDGVLGSSPSWITSAPSGITAKSDFRVAFFIQSPSQPPLAGVSEITPFLDYDTKKTRKDVINRACDKVRVS